MANVKTTLTPKEIELYKSIYNEAAYMGGTHIKFYPVKKKEITDVSSEVYEWEEPISMDVIYDERPKVSLLKRLNWFVEDSEEQPKIMYIPSAIDGTPVKVTRGALIEVADDTNPSEPVLFQVSDTRTHLVQLYYMCNLVPYRKPKEPEAKPDSINNEWLNV